MAVNTTAYYDQTADQYDAIQGGTNSPEHIRALERAWPIVSQCQIQSVLDVGCGTARTLSWFSQLLPGASLSGVDPSQGLLAIAQKRLPNANFQLAPGEKLPQADESVDLVVATGIMHHVDDPVAVIREMFRVSRVAVLVSDHNNFAFGSKAARYIRRWLAASQLLSVATFVKQGFRRQGYTREDGWWYPYSLLDNFGEFARASAEQYLIPTSFTGSQTLDEFQLIQSHLAVLAFKRPLVDSIPSHC